MMRLLQAYADCWRLRHGVGTRVSPGQGESTLFVFGKTRGAEMGVNQADSSEWAWSQADLTVGMGMKSMGITWSLDVVWVLSEGSGMEAWAFQHRGSPSAKAGWWDVSS